MTSSMRSVLRFVAILPLLCCGKASFPENEVPISVTHANDVPYSVFTGGDTGTDLLRYTQDLKMVKVAGRDYYAVTGREKLFLVDPDNFSPRSDGKIPFTTIYTWKTDEKAKNLCVMKGQNEENCQNYIRVFEQVDQIGNKFIVCATNSYDPLCVYLTASEEENGVVLKEDGERFSGTEKCTFGPDQTGVSLYSGESLYSATVSEFSGRSYTITRSLGDEKQLRTPKFDSDFLNEPYFVKMVDIGEKILIFMNEMVRTNNGDVRMLAYVAQVCKNDVGGQHVLVRQWTKFEKTRLNCSLNGFYFDQLQDVSEPVEVRISADSDNTVRTIYATFTTPDYSVPGSAVCAFTVDSIHDALLGRFREERGGAKSNAPTGSRHPGNCPDQQYTESELLFLKSHPLLEDQARGSLLTTHVGERWTSVAVDTQAGPHKNWTVFFVGTTHGQVLRYLAPTGGLKNAALLRRQEVYDAERCGTNITDSENKSVNRIVVDPERNQILVTFKHCITSIPLRSCSVHKCKKSCVWSADPYCGWNGTLCVSYTTPSINVEQYVFTAAVNPNSNVENLCLEEDIVPVANKNGGKSPEATATEEENGDPREDDGGRSGPKYNITNGSFVDGRNSEGDEVSQPYGTKKSIEGGYFQWYIVIAIAIGVSLLSFLIGVCASKKCCNPPKSDVEKQQQGNEMSKASLPNTETIWKRFICSISPKRKRKPPAKQSALSRSQNTLADQQGEPLVTKENSKLDEYVKHHDPSINHQTMLTANRGRNGSPRLDSTSSASQVTMTESLPPSYPASRRHSAQPPQASSVTSMSKQGRQQFSTAPRVRHYSGSRTSEPSSDYSNAPTLRVDRTNSRMSSRHSTPIPNLPTTPTSMNEFFQMENVIESTEQVLDGVQEVIEQQQRRSGEMEPVVEESDEARLRHDSSDSGKGSSPRNSVQTEEQDKLSSLSRSRPENITIPRPASGRKRLNSEPTSPTYDQPPTPPPASRKPVSRSVSVRSQHAMSVPSYAPRKRSESFSNHKSPTPKGHGSPLRMQQMGQNVFQPRARPNVYATLPTKQQSASNGHPPKEKFSRQQSYDTHSPHNNRYPMYDQRDHPAMQHPDRYASLPLRSQAHRTNKKQYAPQCTPYAAQVNGRTNSAGQQIPPPFHKQMSSPAGFEQQRTGQRPRFVPTPTVPGYPVTLLGQDAV